MTLGVRERGWLVLSLIVGVWYASSRLSAQEPPQDSDATTAPMSAAESSSGDDGSESNAESLAGDNGLESEGATSESDSASGQEAETGFDYIFGSSPSEELKPWQAAIGLAFWLVLFGGALAIGIFILLFLHRALQVLPPEHRKIEPGMVWLMLIPCFSAVWCFFVYPRVSESYRSYFHALGRTDVGDCGAGLGIGIAVCILLVSIPCVNYITGIFCGPALLVMTIIYLVKIHDLKRQVMAIRSPVLQPVPNKP
jgi:hypothetical protein